MEDKKLDKETINAIATDVFLQAKEGLEVELDPEVADALGAFEEDAVTSDDLDEDMGVAARSRDDHEEK